MTATATRQPARASMALDARPTSLARVMRSEWIKVRSLRSTWISAGAILLVIVAFGVIPAFVTRPDGAAAATGSGLGTVMTGANLAVLIVAVIGSIAGAREYGTGMIRATFSAVPRRLPVLWAKLAAFTSVVLPTVVVAIFVAFIAGMAAIGATGGDALSLGDDGVLRTLLGTAYYIVGLGIMGLAIGILLRSTAGAIGVVIGAVLFLPALAGALLPDGWDEVLKYLPSNAASAISGIGQDGSTLLSPSLGLLTFTAWILTAVAAAAVALTRRDA